MKNFCKKFVLFLTFFTFKSAIASEIIKVNNIQNKVNVLNIYGERYSVIKNSKIKAGDFLKSGKVPAILILENSKICFSKNSSIKVKSINTVKNKINITILRGKFIFFTNRITKIKFFLKLNENIIQNKSGYIFLSKKKNNSIYIKTFNGDNYLYKKITDKIKLNSNSFYNFQENIDTYKNDNYFKHSDFLRKCYKENYISNFSKEFKYKCSNLNNRIHCGYQ